MAWRLYLHVGQPGQARSICNLQVNYYCRSSRGCQIAPRPAIFVVERSDSLGLDTMVGVGLSNLCIHIVLGRLHAGLGR